MSKETRTIADGRVARRLPGATKGLKLDLHGRVLAAEEIKDVVQRPLAPGYVRVAVPYTPTELRLSGRTYGAHIQVVKKEKVT